MDNMVKIIDLDANKAKKAFLQSKNYFNCNLPEYFDFTPVLKNIDRQLRHKNGQQATLTDIITLKRTAFISELRKCDDININLYLNKDGEYDWRKLQIINPYLYVSLVHLITKKKNWNVLQERFQEIEDECCPSITCSSMPFIKLDGASVEGKDEGINWWKEFEQESLKMALSYKYCVRTDLVNCYGSVYTHTIVWALHGKKTAKEQKSNHNLLGNLIDSAIQNMQNGQTNGILQGSRIFDLIAELILGYSDLNLIERLRKNEIDNYKILRYRDDYRIFANNKKTLDLIVKELSLVSAELNMHFNNAKTLVSNDIISSSIKTDKLYWLDYEPMMELPHISNQKKLLMIYKLALKFPNTGSVKKALLGFRKLLSRKFNKVVNFYSYVYTFNIFNSKDTWNAVQNVFNQQVCNVRTKEYKNNSLDKLYDLLNKKLGLTISIESSKLSEKFKYIISEHDDSNNQLAIKVLSELSKGNISYVRNLFKSNFHSISDVKESFDNYCAENDVEESIKEKFNALLNDKYSDCHQLAAILTMIGIRSPKQIDAVVSCLSVLCDTLNDYEKQKFIDEDMQQFNQKLKEMPNSEYMQLWMQRFFIGNSNEGLNNSSDSSKLLESVNQVCNGNTVTDFWNTSWLRKIQEVDYKSMEENPFVDREKLSEVESIIKINEEDEY